MHAPTAVPSPPDGERADHADGSGHRRGATAAPRADLSAPETGPSGRPSGQSRTRDQRRAVTR
ncbi:hypothetical protein [Streptomyces sp. NPDC060027]|uniref:hypothetical protein n=1 Tax=Streptomyces sp. NPDC060027 TaxID=3347040 RepID=UPI00369DCCB7